VVGKWDKGTYVLSTRGSKKGMSLIGESDLGGNYWGGRKRDLRSSVVRLRIKVCPTANKPRGGKEVKGTETFRNAPEQKNDPV